MFWYKNLKFFFSIGMCAESRLHKIIPGLFTNNIIWSGGGNLLLGNCSSLPDVFINQFHQSVSLTAGGRDNTVAYINCTAFYSTSNTTACSQSHCSYIFSSRIWLYLFQQQKHDHPSVDWFFCYVDHIPCHNELTFNRIINY